jgi:hypothetical protein
MAGNAIGGLLPRREMQALNNRFQFLKIFVRSVAAVVPASA